MTMVLGRPLFRNDGFSGGFSRGSRPMLKIPCARYSTSLDTGKSLYDARQSSMNNYDASSSSSSSTKFGNVALSTPSPSATANGNRVDIAFEKFRKLSEEWIRNREIEAENLFLDSRSPSPQRIFSEPKFYPRRSSSQPSDASSSRDSRSPSPKRSSERSFRSPSSVSNRKSESPYRSIRSRSPSPLVFSSVTKTFFRSNSTDESDSNRDSLIPPSVFRRSSSYDGDRRYNSLPSRSPSPKRSYTPVRDIFRRSSSYENDETIRNNFRARSTSPQRLTPASSYYKRQGNNDDRDFGYYSGPSYSSRSPSPQNNSHILNYFNRNCSKYIYYQPENHQPSCPQYKLYNRSNHNNLKSFYSDPYRKRYSSLPRNIFSTRASPKRDNIINIFNQGPVNSHSNEIPVPNGILVPNGATSSHTNPNKHIRFNNQPNNDDSLETPLISPNRPTDKQQFLQNTLPDISHYRMTSPRRFSEEPSPFRRPLATLHEDEVTARRRFSDDLRKKSYDTSDIMNDYNLHQRKLSEAGVRRLSDFLDASLVLTEDTDSFIIGDRVYVGGTKPGSISYIGETQFAPGEWAGVTLDEPIGKNNGTVGGVRYFMCEPKKGVFSRLTRLSRYLLSDYDLELLAAKQGTTVRRGSESPPKGPTPPPCSATTQAARKITPTQQSSDTYRKTSQPSEPVRKVTPSSPGSKSPLYGKSGSPSPANSVKKGPPPSFLNLNTDLILGDRVVIDSTSGTKYGVLRYLGRTEFADGIWAGVELDDPSGKNDGSVAGKKYFICRSKYGLFAPMSRVRPFSTRSNSTPRSTPAPRPTPTVRRAGSKESLGGSSVASSTTVSSIKGPRRSYRTSNAGTDPSTKALQNNERYDDEDWFY